jgi:hypothetical protein|tara:strand:+ start:679 stop:813 length:135 start_codon:yes stop_codon:yes gene_type:complete
MSSAHKAAGNRVAAINFLRKNIVFHPVQAAPAMLRGWREINSNP